MKVGDLVRPIGRFAEDLSQVNPMWTSPAIIVKGPYEGSVTHLNQMGAPRATEVRLVIDVMILGRLVKGLPVSDFSRVTRREVDG